MATVLENAKKHFLEKVQSEPRLIRVPEWDADIYVKPLTLKDQDRIYKFVREGSLESLAETLIVRAKNKDGSPIFSSVNKTELMNMVDPDVMQRVVVQMADELSDVEEIEGN